MLALAIRGGVRHKFVDHTDELVTIELTRDGFKPFRCSWSIADAKRAGLAGRQNWRKFPRAMLRARVISEALRAYAPDLLGGAYVPGEVQQDGEPEEVIDAQIVEEEPPAHRDDAGVGDREMLEVLFAEQLEVALTSKTIAQSDGAAATLRGWLEADREKTLDDLFAAAWALIMPAAIDGAQAAKMARRLQTEDGQKGLRRSIYTKLRHIVERMQETP